MAKNCVGAPFTMGPQNSIWKFYDGPVDRTTPHIVATPLFITLLIFEYLPMLKFEYFVMIL